ncbi:hypothetical protein C8Q75DRAFT_710409 [Abortiporus biennis]|nr:hypothetical protein C8Q75DRAFT_710409 [Abortiporus biennis]
MTVLLQWCSLEPQGPSNLAAIRFNSPVRVHSIIIYPSGARPFSQNEDIKSQTEPDAFFLEIYFNAHPISQPNVKDKPKATNALVPTVIAYAGGKTEFVVDMSSEQATRLMIVRGGFSCISMAIYGDIVPDSPSSLLPYVPKSLPFIEPQPLSRPLDPSNASDPTDLARKLLKSIPGAPPLPLIIRLLFCLKPQNDDWDLPDFPYLFSNLDDVATDADLEKIFELTSRPVADEVSEDTLDNFAKGLARLIVDKDADQSYHVAGILRHSACQTPDLTRALLENVDLTKVFDSTNMDEPTLLRLLDAAASADVARYLNNDWFLDEVTSIEKNPNFEKVTRSAARQLLSRIQGWSALEDALSNTQGDFAEAAAALADMSSQEASFGILLESLVAHPDLVEKLAENPVMHMTFPHPPYLLQKNKPSVSHDEFIAFIRAFIGVSCVLAVYAWADSLPEPPCRKRIQGIWRLWQTIDGYREILNHLLLLPQMIYRLECLLDSELPTPEGVDSEHILVNLAQDPLAILSTELVDCILSLKPPHSFITYDERMSMRRAAIVVDDGFMGAIDELLRPVERPPTMKSLRALRVALAMIVREMDEQGEYEVVEKFWTEGPCELLLQLTDLLAIFSEEISTHFTVGPPPPTPAGVVTQLFRAATETMRLLLRLAPSFTLLGHAIRSLTTNSANVFTCSDAAEMSFNEFSPTSSAAAESRQTATHLIRILADPTLILEGGKSGAEVVMRSLLRHGLDSGERDPTHHLLQVFSIIDYILPLPDSEEQEMHIWAQKVFPELLKDIWEFCQVIDQENKVYFIRRLVGIDDGVIGIGDWLLLEELKETSNTLELLEQSSLEPNYRLFKQYQVSLSLKVVEGLMTSSSDLDVSSWCIDCMASNHDVVNALVTCLWSMLIQDLISPHITGIAQILGSEVLRIEYELRNPLSAILLRSCWSIDMPSAKVTALLGTAQSMLSTIPENQLDSERIGLEIGLMISAFDVSRHPLDEGLADAFVELFDWFAKAMEAKPCKLMGLNVTSYDTFCDRLKSNLDADKQENFDSLRQSILKTGLVEGDFPIRTPTILPDTIELGIQDVQDLLQEPVSIPSTPPRKAFSQDILSLVTISPPTALIRSPATTGLTKTYSKNDFRQLRQTPSARQNTSRLPSMHVDVGSITT